MKITEAEYADVLKIRQEVMYPDHDIEFVKLEDDDQGLHFGVFVEGRNLVSVVSIFMQGRDVQFRKLATLEAEQGKGYASHLMKWIIDYARDVKLDRLWCNARADAVGFYKKFEYRETDLCFSKNGHNYVVMERVFVHS